MFDDRLMLFNFGFVLFMHVSFLYLSYFVGFLLFSCLHDWSLQSGKSITHVQCLIYDAVNEENDHD